MQLGWGTGGGQLLFKVQLGRGLAGVIWDLALNLIPPAPALLRVSGAELNPENLVEFRQPPS